MKQITSVVGCLMLIGCGAQVKLNVAPEINARAGQPVRFDAFTPEAPNSKYSWEFGDGTKAQGATLQHTYTKPGEYTAQLKLKGDGKRGKANIKVKVGPPSALSVIPKEAGFAVVVDSVAEAKTAWDIFYKLPFLTNLMEEAKGDITEELGFFVLEEGELASRGFDASLGGAFGVMTIEDQFVPLLVGGIKSDGKALEWVKGFLSKEGLSTKDEQIDGVTITHTYYRNREIGAIGSNANFLIYSPTIKTSTDYHVKAIKAALNTAKDGSIFDNEWAYHAGVSGGASMYLQGGDFLIELSREMDSNRELRQLASSLRTTAKSLNSISASVRSVGGDFEADLAFWMTEEGLKNYQALAPQVPLLDIAPSMTAGAFFYLSGRIDPLEAAKQGVAGLPPSERAQLEGILEVAKGLGFDLIEDFGKPLGAANAMLISIDVDGLIASLSGYDAMPFEFVWAYELEDTEKFKKALSGLAQTASVLTMGSGFRIDTKTSGNADIYAVNLGWIEFAWAVGPGITILSASSGPGTIEKAMELITPSKNQAKNKAEEQKFVIQFSQIRQKLSEAQTELKSTGRATEQLPDLIEALKSFQQLTGQVSTDGDTVRSKMTLELTK